MHTFLRATVLFSVLSGNLSDAFSPVYTRKSTAIRQLYMSDIVGSNEGVDRNGQQNLMNRGLMEEELLQGDQQSFLEMASEDERQDALDRQKKLVKERKKLMKNSGGGGFGAASKGKKPSGHTEFNARVDKDGFGAVVMEEGVARVNGCMSIETSQNLLAFVNQQLLDSIDEVSNGEADEISRFADVLGKKKRWDMLLPLEESNEVMQALHEIFYSDASGLGGAIESIVGKDAKLYELSALISDPGSERQAIHPDFPYQDTIPPALTSFIALQDIEPDMGPTTFLPRSSSAEFHQELKDRLWDSHARQGLLATSPNKLNTLGISDCSLYNPMTLHCGGANRSDKRRVLFYFSFYNPVVGAETLTQGASLRPELKERDLTLKNIKKIVKDWKKAEVKV
ncbi:hypothetical protein CTEN210_10105 [Chaetoceros tenuissimus]|uniref:Phytanoyl-CoA dioxygenase n=1 Tax=Chaetoceros tenuissimus TaxID=426638 RepID=A0AAD3H8A4_9STRA|nr:hypothetical protein CTEN210_10105 [Chaetoceros tenuissimus]